MAGLRDLPPDNNPLAYQQVPETMSMPGQPLSGPDASAPAPDYSVPDYGNWGEFGRGLRSSGLNIGASAESLYGGIMNDQSALLAGRNDAQSAAAISPIVGSLKDIHGVGDVPSYIAGKTGELVPYVGAATAGSLAGPLGGAIGGAGLFGAQ